MNYFQIAGAKKKKKNEVSVFHIFEVVVDCSTPSVGKASLIEMVLLKLAETQDRLLDSTKVPRTLNRTSSRTRDHLEVETNVHLNQDQGNNSGVRGARVYAVERLI